MLKKFVVRYLFRSGKARGWYKRLARPTAKQWADYLRLHGGLESIGQDCEINNDVTITDPYLVRIGNHVTLSSCHLIAHDGSIRQIQRSLGVRVGAVGKIDIRDNCFIGFNAIIMRNVTIGPNSIVAAGAVVTKDVPPNSVVGGVPAKVITSLEALGHKLQEEARSLPWCHHILNREGAYDRHIESQLKSMRREYFWGANRSSTTEPEDS